jgi:immune inhibitor A
MKHKILAVVTAVIIVLTMATPVLANPPSPDGPETDTSGLGEEIDQPSLKDYLRVRERWRLLEAGQTAEANALDQTGTDRVLMILVEFAGTDVFTWTAGVSTWDPLGIADPAENTGTVGDCSLIQEKIEATLGYTLATGTEITFTYTGPMHNEIPRPISSTHRSGDSVWTEDFSTEWFEDFMFGNGVEISYTTQAGESIYASFVGQSLTDYYTDMSSGVYTVTGDVIGWLQIPHSTWYYGADECPGARSGGGRWHGATGNSSRDLARDALDYINTISDTIPGFDWANYDGDGDGIIDRLWFAHSGYGEEDATVLLNATDYGEAAIWSHSSSGFYPPYTVTHGIAAGPYIWNPENGGICVFAHEAGHNLGADDLYSYGDANTSAGFWTLMADSWTGFPIGFEPPAMDPWHLDGWGWLDPMVITDTSQVYTFTLGQASRFPGGTDVYRGAKIELPDSAAPRSVQLWQGDYYWWGGEGGANAVPHDAMMSTVAPIDLTSATAVTLSFDTAYHIEAEWDALFVQVSTDGVTWNYTDTLTNDNTECTFDPNWVGGALHGFPVDPCTAGIGGFYGYNTSWPAPDTQVFDLSAYAGQSIYLRLWYMSDWYTYFEGPFVDNIVVEADGSVVFEDDAESGDANWTYTGRWVRTIDMEPFTHNFYLQWRNVNENGGYDSTLGEGRWRFGPANTGLLVWYNNNYYSNNETQDYLFDWPSWGPKGRALVVEAHPDPYRDPDLVAAGWNNEGGNLTSRGQMRDAPFTLADTIPFTHTDPYRDGAQEHTYPGRPAVSTFRDAQGYYPGAEWVNRGSYYPPTQYKWVTKQWDVSAVVPSQATYPLNAVGYDGSVTNDAAEFRWECDPYLTGPYAGALGCYWLGNDTGLGYEGGVGSPGQVDGQYGWVVELIEEATDHTTATVRVYNDPSEFMYQLVTFDTTHDPAMVAADAGDTYTVTYQTVVENSGNEVANNVYVTYTLDADLTAVSLMMDDGIGTVEFPPTTVWWTDELPAGTTVTLTLKATGVAETGVVQTRVDAHDGLTARGPWFYATSVEATYYIYLPVVMKNSTGTVVLP